MNILDYDQFERQQLIQIQKEIDIELKKRDKSIRQDLRKRIQKMVEEEGFSVDEVMSPSKSKANTPKNPPKYRNPEDSAATWTGLGRKPLWVLAALESGQSLDELLI